MLTGIAVWVPTSPVPIMSLKFTIARCKEKRNHSKSAHISQRSFLYGEEFFRRNTTITKQGTQKDEEQQIRGGKKNEKRHNIRWMKGWSDYHTQWKVWQLRLENVKCLGNALTTCELPFKVKSCFPGYHLLYILLILRRNEMHEIKNPSKWHRKRRVTCWEFRTLSLSLLLFIFS